MVKVAFSSLYRMQNSEIATKFVSRRAGDGEGESNSPLSVSHPTLPFFVNLSRSNRVVSMNSLKIIMDYHETYAKSFSASPERKRLCLAEIWRLHFNCQVFKEFIMVLSVFPTQDA